MHNKQFLESLDKIEENIGYRFKKREFLILAMTHSSYANENKLLSNERLEFLGDSVLNITISEYIYTHFPELSEGDMTKMRANIVCEYSLNECANNIHLGDFLLLGKGESLSGGRKRASILSDAYEALLGAMYLDSGMEQVRKFILFHMENLINNSIKGIIAFDYKTQLQEIVQRKNDQRVIYEIVKESGPDHNKLFVSCVKVAGKVLGVGEGKSKKESEQRAAKIALESLSF